LILFTQIVSQSVFFLNILSVDVVLVNVVLSHDKEFSVVMVIKLDIFESLKPFVKSFINVQIFPLLLLQVMRQIYGEDLVLRGEYDQMSVQFDYFLNFGCVRSCYL
jgi:hypothetical protein